MEYRTKSNLHRVQVRCPWRSPALRCYLQRQPRGVHTEEVTARRVPLQARGPRPPYYNSSYGPLLLTQTGFRVDGHLGTNSGGRRQISKACEVKASEGSNPSATARMTSRMPCAESVRTLAPGMPGTKS